MTKKPVLVTLTSPSAAGKSYLLEHIRKSGHPCLISTTTRAPRAGEVEGYDYFFITEEESKRIESENGFAELAIFNGKRYGVTNEEFFSKLSTGLTFLIVEPSGIDHYVEPALKIGAKHLKYYVHVDPQVRMKRFRDRVDSDLKQAIQTTPEAVFKIVHDALNRQQLMLTNEMQWGQAAVWDRILFGDKHPEENLQIILNDVVKIQNKD